MDVAPISILLKALDGLSARSVVTAQNIANAGTPNYRPLRVSFEDALAAASARGAEDVQAVQPAIAPAQGSDGGELRLDLELATASGTAMRYAGLVEALTRELQMTSLAIRGNV